MFVCSPNISNSSLSRSNFDFVSDKSHHYGYHFSLLMWYELRWQSLTKYCCKTSLFYISISKIGLTCSASMSLHTHLTNRATCSHNSMLPTCLLFFIVLLGRTYSCCSSSLVECPWGGSSIPSVRIWLLSGENERSVRRSDHRNHGWGGDRCAAGSWDTAVLEVSAFPDADKE